MCPPVLSLRPAVSLAKGVDCINNFDKIWTDQAPLDSPCGTPGAASKHDAFEGFTYVAPSFLQSLNFFSLTRSPSK
jgi:Protein kinase C terminal domain